MSEIEILKIMPEVKKTEDGYSYDDKYLNRVFLYEAGTTKEYVYFGKQKYTSFTAPILDSVIEKILQSKIEEISRTVLENVKDELTKNLNVEFNSRFESMNTTLDNIEEFLQSKVEIDEIKPVIEEFLQSKVEIDEIKPIIEDKFKEFEQKLSKTETPQMDEEKIQEMISNELSIVHSNLPNVVNELIDKKFKTSENVTEKLTPGKLLALKELGMSIQEITELHKTGVI